MRSSKRAALENALEEMQRFLDPSYRRRITDFLGALRDYRGFLLWGFFRSSTAKQQRFYLLWLTLEDLARLLEEDAAARLQTPAIDGVRREALQRVVTDLVAWHAAIRRERFPEADTAMWAIVGAVVTMVASIQGFRGRSGLPNRPMRLDTGPT